SASQPSRSRKVSAALTIESRLSLAGRRPAGPDVAARAAPGDCGAAICPSPFVRTPTRDLGKLTPLVSRWSVEALLTELGELPGDRAQIGQHRGIHRLDRPGDDVGALCHVDAARVG